MIRVCRYCRAASVVPGPRNAKAVGVCAADACRLSALLLLAEADMLDDAEWAELERRLL